MKKGNKFSGYLSDNRSATNASHVMVSECTVSSLQTVNTHFVFINCRYKPPLTQIYHYRKEHFLTLHKVCWYNGPGIESEFTKNPGLNTATPPALTYVLTAWSRVLLQKLTGFQPVKKFPAFYGTRKFLTVFTSARHLSLS